MRRLSFSAAVALGVTLHVLGAPAWAEGLGVYVPTAPFSGPVARLDCAADLADKLGNGLVGRAYANAADFAAAVRRGDVRYAVIDAAYAATAGVGWTVLAVTGRDGQTEIPWQVVSARPATGIAALRGLTVAVPVPGGSVEVFLYQVLLEGELPRDFFARVVEAPDALSALAAVERGRADCAVVPADLDLPAGVHRVATLLPVSGPVLVAMPGAQNAAAVAAAAPHVVSIVLGGFTPSGDGPVRALRERLGRSVRDGRRLPFLVPPLRAPTGPLLGGQTYSIARPSLAGCLVEPAAPPNHR